ncbi:MAG TPA: hypothetical protein VMJ65_00695 [Solirubrobacteraceae bacterium]|nr:hypothetical protein [Solirubrobacteraceae bacterium]
MNPEAPSLKAIILRHKAASAAAFTIVIVLIGVMAAAALPNAKGGALSDSSTCSAWSSATRAQQSAYAHLYVTEHGSHVSGALTPASVESATDSACSHAAYLGEADDVSIVAALNRAF